MQIREKGKKILCIRTAYNSDLKRSVGETVATQDRWLDRVSDDVREKLTDAEAEQLEQWLKARTESRSADSLKSSLTLASFTLARSAEALGDEAIAAELTPEKADQIWQQMAVLQKALKKAGFKKPVKEKQPLAAGDTQTQQLPL